MQRRRVSGQAMDDRSICRNAFGTLHATDTGNPLVALRGSAQQMLVLWSASPGLNSGRADVRRSCCNPGITEAAQHCTKRQRLHVLGVVESKDSQDD